MYSVYIHISPSNKIYIGITCQEPRKRWRNGHGYIDNDYFTRAIRKYGWENFQHEILYENLTKDEAEFIEVELINYYNADMREYGYNIKKGGSTSGKHSEETKRKISESLKGEKNPRYGKKFSGNNVKRNKRNYVYTEEMRIRKSLSHKGQIPVNKIPVEQCDKNGKHIANYESIKSASIITGIDISNISRCLKAERKTAGGYIWKTIKKYNEIDFDNKEDLLLIDNCFFLNIKIQTN